MGFIKNAITAELSISLKELCKHRMYLYTTAGLLFGLPIICGLIVRVAVASALEDDCKSNKWSNLASCVVMILIFIPAWFLRVDRPLMKLCVS